jgi:uncharacterized membrane protein YdjX (TVP38/TMEM64 family)
MGQVMALLCVMVVAAPPVYLIIRGLLWLFGPVWIFVIVVGGFILAFVIGEVWSGYKQRQQAQKENDNA